MPNKILLTVQDGTPKQIVFADHAGDFSPATANDLRDGTAGNREDVQLTLGSLLSGSYRQSAKVDLGDDRAEAYDVLAVVELAGSSGMTERVDFHWGPSPQSTAANGNPGNLTGSDASFLGYASDPEGTANNHLDFIGTLVQASSNGIVTGVIGTLYPSQRYGMLVVGNEGDNALQSDDIEMHIVLIPIIREVQ